MPSWRLLLTAVEKQIYDIVDKLERKLSLFIMNLMKTYEA